MGISRFPIEYFGIIQSTSEIIPLDIHSNWKKSSKILDRFFFCFIYFCSLNGSNVFQGSLWIESNHKLLENELFSIVLIFFHMIRRYDQIVCIFWTVKNDTQSASYRREFIFCLNHSPSYRMVIRFIIKFLYKTKYE